MKYFSKLLRDRKKPGSSSYGDNNEAAQTVRKKKVLLVVTGNEQERKSFLYAMNVSKRVNAGLDILCLSPEDQCERLLERHLKEMVGKGADYHIARITKSIHDEVIRYIKQSPQIEFVVIDSQDIENASAKDRQVIHEWKGLGCPLVLVS
ncbi:MAG: hypothetical protein ACOYVJ_06745 [Nitrospirota bacterium]